MLALYPGVAKEAASHSSSLFAVISVRPWPPNVSRNSLLAAAKLRRELADQTLSLRRAKSRMRVSAVMYCPVALSWGRESSMARARVRLSPFSARRSSARMARGFPRSGSRSFQFFNGETGGAHGGFCSSLFQLIIWTTPVIAAFPTISSFFARGC